MAITPETFSGQGLTNWTGTANAADQTVAVNQIVANRHVDLRTFETTLVSPRSISTIDGSFLGTQGDVDPATLDETVLSTLDSLVLVPGELWAPTLTTGLRQSWTDSGVSATNYIYVGPLPNRQNWNGAKLLTNGSAPIRVTIDSQMGSAVAPPIDISGMDYLTMVFPSIKPTDMNLTTSYVQLSSLSDGSFVGTFGKVLFSREAANNLDAYLEEIRLPISEFANDPSIDLTQITGVRIHIETIATPANNTSLTVMAVRAIASTWQYHTLDVNTKSGRYVQAVSPRGIDPSASEQFYPLVRSSTSDPTPTDSALLMYFNCGQLATSGSAFNQIELVFREQHDTATSGTYVVARLEFNGISTQASYFANTVTPGSKNSSGLVLYSGASGPPPLIAAVPGSDSGWYLFKATIQNSRITMYLYDSDADGAVGITPLWTNSSSAVSDVVNFPPQQGRVGWNARFVDYDVQLNTWQAAATAFSAFVTKVFASHTPVDGAQLIATYSGDENLFSLFQGVDVKEDANRTLSSSSSFRASQDMESNTVQIDDWTHTYLDFDIFAPNTMTTDSQPVIYTQQVASGVSGALTPLLCSSTQAPTVNPSVSVLDFTYGQWTHVTLPLSQVSDLVTGNYHFVWAPLAGAEVTTWWVDNMKIGRQTIEWEVKARADLANWRPFGSLVNDPTAAVHFSRTERGTELQLQCRALTEDAWVSNYILTPHYTELGKPTYYNGRVTDG